VSCEKNPKKIVRLKCQKKEVDLRFMGLKGLVDDQIVVKKKQPKDKEKST